MSKVINGINVKGKLGQFFCSHHHQEWFKESGKPTANNPLGLCVLAVRRNI